MTEPDILEKISERTHILAPATAGLTFGQANRGTFDRMDVAVTLPINDVDGDGLPEEVRRGAGCELMRL